MRVIEPSVVRLTSDETRMLMRAAVNPKGVAMPYNGTGVKDLGLVREVKERKGTLSSVKRQLKAAQDKAVSAKSWKALQAALKLVERADRNVRYFSKEPSLFTLTEAGKKLVSSITIRRR